MLQQTLGYELRQLDAETFEVEEINDVGIDGPVVIIDDGGGDPGIGVCSCSTSCSATSCSCGACCSCSTSTSS